MSLVFVVWCLSGIILMFDGFPHASRKDRFLHLQTFQPADFDSLKTPNFKGKGTLMLEICDGKPVYRMKKGMRAETVYDAQTLKPIDRFSEAEAVRQSSSYCRSTVEKVTLTNELDQWIPWPYYKPLLPFYKCYLAGADHSVVYVSTKTGAIIQHTTRKERWAARLGAIPHWAYFSFLRQRTGAWETVIVVLSIIGLLVSISGIVAGFIRLKKKKGITPYKRFWYKWHHLSGFFFGLFLCTFILSGMISVTNVPDWLVFVKSAQKEKIKWTQKTTDKLDAVTPKEIYQALEQKEGIRKIEWRHIFDRLQFWVYYNNYRVPVAYFNKQGNVEKVKPYSLKEVEKMAKQALIKHDFKVSIQSEYDSYYASSGMLFLPKPVYKIERNDAAQTWLFIDPKTGDNVKTIDRNYRARRWLYRALHTFNFPVLQNIAWLRKSILFVLCLTCLAISLTGFMLSFKFFKRKKKSKRN